MSLSLSSVRALITGLASRPVGNEVASGLNTSSALATATSHTIVAAIVATGTSPTADFGALAVGDLVVAIPVAAGNAIYYTVATAGTLPANAVEDTLYVVLRAFTAPAASNVSL